MTSVPDFVMLFKGHMHLDVDYMAHGGTSHTVCHIAWYCCFEVVGRVPFPFACCVSLSLLFENGNGTPYAPTRSGSTLEIQATCMAATDRYCASNEKKRLYSTSFVKANAPGSLTSSGTAVSSDFLKNYPENQKKTQHCIKSQKRGATKIMIAQPVLW